MEKKQYKIWWQSSTKIDLLSGYKEAVEAHAKKILGDQFLVEMHGVETSPNATQWSYFEMLNSRDMMENFFRAQEEGFDCIAIGCFSDPCLQEAREALDIPVVSIAENAIAWARMYGASACIVISSFENGHSIRTSIPSDATYDARSCSVRICCPPESMANMIPVRPSCCRRSTSDKSFW